jgi:predicted RNA-binding Zn ribbon-like protein
MTAQERAPFQLIAGHPVLDFVNTLDDRFAPGGSKELLLEPEDMLRFSVQSGLISKEQAAKISKSQTRTLRKDTLQAVRQVRETVARVLYKIVDGREAGPVSTPGPDPNHIVEFNMIFRISAPMKHLSWTGDSKTGRMKWEWDGEVLDLPVYKLIAAAADLLTSDQLGLVRKCANPACQWLFLASGKNNHVRRWCDMKICGNRMKARRHQSRVRAAAVHRRAGGANDGSD